LQDSGCRSLVIFATTVSPDIPTRPEDDLERPPLTIDDDVTETPEPEEPETEPEDNSDMILWVIGGLVVIVSCLLVFFLMLQFT